jgi:hypothetical protein
MRRKVSAEDAPDLVDQANLVEEDAIRFLENESEAAEVVDEEPVVGLVPTIDQEEPVASYDDWLPEQTEVITCCIGDAPYKGRPFETYADAKATIKQERGRVLEYNAVPGRAFFRVFKVRP